MGGMDQNQLKQLSEELKAARKLENDFAVLTNGEHEGIRGVNRLVEEAISENLIKELVGYDTMRREVKYGTNSRVDILLSAESKPDCYVEVKNVHLMRQPGLAEFPDSVTKRGAKHLVELGEMVKAGNRAVMFYLVQRTDCERFSVAADIDPTYAIELEKAMVQGVEAICYDCSINTERIEVRAPLQLDL